jgi:hypothetical protein
MVGPVAEAALLLDRLLGGDLLPEPFMTEMLKAYAVPGPVPDRPWLSPGYGLGLMIGEVGSGQRVAGHTGGGPGSTIAVYRSQFGPSPRTAAFFATCEQQARTEEQGFRLLGQGS